MYNSPSTAPLVRQLMLAYYVLSVIIILFCTHLTSVYPCVCVYRFKKGVTRPLATTYVTYWVGPALMPTVSLGNHVKADTHHEAPLIPVGLCHLWAAFPDATTHMPLGPAGLRHSSVPRIYIGHTPGAAKLFTPSPARQGEWRVDSLEPFRMDVPDGWSVACILRQAAVS